MTRDLQISGNTPTSGNKEPMKVTMTTTQQSDKGGKEDGCYVECDKGNGMGGGRNY